jgi:hypothetical protein
MASYPGYNIDPQGNQGGNQQPFQFNGYQLPTNGHDNVAGPDNGLGMNLVMNPHANMAMNPNMSTGLSLNNNMVPANMYQNNHMHMHMGNNMPMNPSMNMLSNNMPMNGNMPMNSNRFTNNGMPENNMMLMNNSMPMNVNNSIPMGMNMNHNGPTFVNTNVAMDPNLNMGTMNPMHPSAQLPMAGMGMGMMNPPQPAVQVPHMAINNGVANSVPTFNMPSIMSLTSGSSSNSQDPGRFIGNLASHRTSRRGHLAPNINHGEVSSERIPERLAPTFTNALPATEEPSPAHRSIPPANLSSMGTITEAELAGNAAVYMPGSAAVFQNNNGLYEVRPSQEACARIEAAGTTGNRAGAGDKPMRYFATAELDPASRQNGMVFRWSEENPKHPLLLLSEAGGLRHIIGRWNDKEATSSGYFQTYFGARLTHNHWDATLADIGEANPDIRAGIERGREDERRRAANLVTVPAQTVGPIQTEVSAQTEVPVQTPAGASQQETQGSTSTSPSSLPSGASSSGVPSSKASSAPSTPDISPKPAPVVPGPALSAPALNEFPVIAVASEAPTAPESVSSAPKADESDEMASLFGEPTNEAASLAPTSPTPGPEPATPELALPVQQPSGHNTDESSNLNDPMCWGPTTESTSLAPNLPTSQPAPAVPDPSLAVQQPNPENTVDFSNLEDPIWWKPATESTTLAPLPTSGPAPAVPDPTLSVPQSNPDTTDGSDDMEYLTQWEPMLQPTSEVWEWRPTDEDFEQLLRGS